ncbi:hypothetical protein CDAR_572401 [Caerostris darwini]|uniref:Uncharacterized protein n=1 Tax=Caerostris darwini TaxID=1538125 RepID=A0AAV4U6H9_9ARAC|nr:hypothetical protein CDAR_572401 [Caerostris darwini]
MFHSPPPLKLPPPPFPFPAQKKNLQLHNFPPARARHAREELRDIFADAILEKSKEVGHPCSKIQKGNFFSQYQTVEELFNTH